jgi:pimeloyl-ACP methyl ester carboxylesterase
MRRLLMTVAVLTTLSAPTLAAEREVVISAGKGELHGTLRTPDGFTKGPAVLMIAGSGPTDRNGDSTAPGVRPGAFRLLADALEKAGVPTLRYDKRGVGASMSALIGAAPLTNASAYAAEADLRFTDMAADADAMAAQLAKTPGVSCVVILGHSEGSLVGMLAAERFPVCGYVSVSGLGRTADHSLHEQLAASLPAATLAQADDVLGKLKAGQTVPDAPLPALFRPSVQPYLISWLQIDPAAEIARIKAPVLILQGDNDFQVSVTEARALAAARPDAKLVIVPGMNHILKLAPTDRAANAATYADPALPLAPELVSAITAFVKEVDARH